jgi:hypothetical protein
VPSISLLHALARDIARDRRVVRLTRYFVDFVDVDDAVLGLLHIVVALLQQLLDDVLDVLTDVAGFGQRGGIGHDERHIQESCQGLGQQSFSGTGRANQQDIALGQFHFVVFGLIAQAHVVIVHRHRQGLLCRLLADHILIKDVPYLLGNWQVALAGLVALLTLNLLAYDVVAKLDALIANKNRRARDEFPHLMLALAAKRAIQ